MAMEGLILNIKQRGAPETAKALSDVADAQARLTDEVTNQATAIEQATQAGDELEKSTGLASASMSNWSGVLGRINPTLGAMAAAANSAARAVGSLGSAFAGSVLVAGVLAFIKALQAIRAEVERVNQAWRDQSSAMDQVAARRRGLAKTIENLADLRRDKRLTADESRAAVQTAERIQARFGDSIEVGAVARAVATLHGRGLDEGQIARAARLSQLGLLDLQPDSPRAAVHADVMISRHRAMLDEFVERAEQQRRESVQGARTQAFGLGGKTLDLREAVKEAVGPHATEDAIDKLIEDLRLFGGHSSGLATALQKQQGGPPDLLARIIGYRALQSEDSIWTQYRAEEHLRTLENVMRHIEQMADSVERFASQPKTVIDNRAARFFASDGQTQKDRRVNAGSIIADLEER